MPREDTDVSSPVQPRLRRADVPQRCLARSSFRCDMTNVVRAQFQNIFSPGRAADAGQSRMYVHGKLARPAKLDSRDSTVIADGERPAQDDRSPAFRRRSKTLQDARRPSGSCSATCCRCARRCRSSAATPGARVAQRCRLDATACSDGMSVLYSGGVVGRIDRVGVSGGAQVRLITDPGFSVQGSFVRFVNDEHGGRPSTSRSQPPRPLVQGAGNGMHDHPPTCPWKSVQRACRPATGSSCRRPRLAADAAGLQARASSSRSSPPRRRRCSPRSACAR